MGAHGVANPGSASLASQKVLTALSACLGTLTPAQREALLNRIGAGGGGVRAAARGRNSACTPGRT